MVNSYIYYTGDGNITEYQVTFDYLSKEFVKVYLDGDLKEIETDYIFSGDRTIVFLTVPANGSSIFIQRVTAKDRLVEFRDASILVAQDLDVSALQAIHIAEESLDKVNNSITPDALNNLDAQDRRIVNVAPPVDPTDAASKEYVDTIGNQIFQDAQAEADRAALEAGAAELSATSASNSATLSTTKANEASASSVKAQEWAEKAVDVQVEAGQFSSKHHATKAALSASQASAQKVLCDGIAAQVILDGQTSATNADNASESASDAMAYAQSASSSATEAAASASAAAGNASTVASQVQTAIDKATEAANSANAANTSAGNASTSANTAITKAQQAVDNANLAQQYSTDALASKVAAESSANSAANNANAASTSNSLAQAAATLATQRASEATTQAGLSSSSSVSAVNASNVAGAAKADCEAIRDGLQTASTHSHDNKPFLDGLNEMTIAGYNVIRAQSLPSPGDHPQGTFCVVDAIMPKKVYLNIGLAWIEIPAGDALYGKITKFDDVKLLWRDVDGGQISAVGDNPNWSYSGPMYAEDGSYVGLNTPTDVNGDGQLWWSGPAYTNKIVNPLCVGGGVGVAPTGWSTGGSSNGIVLSIVNAGPGWVEYRWAGTASAHTYLTITTHPSTAGHVDFPDALVGQTWTGQAKCEIVAGDIPVGGLARLHLTEFSSTGTFLVESVAPFTRSSLNPVIHTRTLTSPTVAKLRLAIQVFFPSGASGDITLRVSQPQLTQTPSSVPFAGPAAGNMGAITVNSLPPVPAIHGEKGVWCGPSYTNMILAGREDFTNTGWVKTRISAERYGDAYKLIENAENAARALYTSVTMVGGTTYTFTIKAKANERSVISIFPQNVTSAAANFDLVNKTSRSSVTTNLVSHSISEVEGGFLECSLTFTAASSGPCYCNFYMLVNYGGTPSASYAGDGVSSIIVKHPIVTQTPTPMPYVPPGTTVPSAAGTTGGNGVYFDMAKEPDGVELVFNGGFDTNVDGWTATTATLAYVSGKLQVTPNGGSAGDARQVVSVVPNCKYRISVGAITNGLVYVYNTSGTSGLFTGFPISSGYLDVTPTTSVILIRLYVAVGVVGTFDNISVQRLSSPLMQCFEKPETDGVELVANGTFDANVDGWDAGTANAIITWVGGEVCTTRTGSSTTLSPMLRQTITTQNGVMYRVSFDAYSPTYVGTLRIDTGAYSTSLGSNAVSCGRPVTPTKQRYSAVVTSNGNASIRINAEGVAFITNETIYFDNISVQKLKPATSTVAALVTMGVGSVDLVNDQRLCVLSSKNAGGWSTDFGYGKGGGGSATIINTWDETNLSQLNERPWSRNEQHLKIVQTNALGTQYRVGNKRIGIDSAIQWSTWANYDGSFNPLTALRLAFSNTVPIWIKRVMVSNKGGMTGADIETRINYN